MSAAGLEELRRISKDAEPEDHRITTNLLYRDPTDRRWRLYRESGSISA
jgi:hypothetical protein